MSERRLIALLEGIWPSTLVKNKDGHNFMKKLEIFMACKKPYIVVQKFGQDFSGPACNFNKDFPCDKTLYQHFGLKGHEGWDFYAYAKGSFYIVDFPLYAPIEGVIEYIENDVSLGLGIVIKTTEKYLDNTGQPYYWKIRLWHLAKNSIVAKFGQKVAIGDYLGMADNTGYSTRLHTHMDLKPVDDNFNNVFQNNDFKGAVDLAPYLSDLTAFELRKLLYQTIPEMLQKIAEQVASLIKSWKK